MKSKGISWEYYLAGASLHNFFFYYATVYSSDVQWLYWIEIIHFNNSYPCRGLDDLRCEKRCCFNGSAVQWVNAGLMCSLERRLANVTIVLFNFKTSEFYHLCKVGSIRGVQIQGTLLTFIVWDWNSCSSCHLTFIQNTIWTVPLEILQPWGTPEWVGKATTELEWGKLSAILESKGSPHGWDPQISDSCLWF